jgi:hypothetical protein
MTASVVGEVIAGRREEDGGSAVRRLVVNRFPSFSWFPGFRAHLPVGRALPIVPATSHESSSPGL